MNNKILRALRVYHHISQTDLAFLLDVRPEYYSKLELGIFNMSDELVERLFVGLDTDRDQATLIYKTL